MCSGDAGTSGAVARNPSRVAPQFLQNLSILDTSAPHFGQFSFSSSLMPLKSKSPSQVFNTYLHATNSLQMQKSPKILAKLLEESQT